ncbi:unnamed protein product, partial [Coregonus sp. 'balchen']
MRPTLRKVVLITLLGRDQSCRKRRSVWVQRWLKSRKQAGEFHLLIQELRLFLATGDSYRTIGFSFRVGRSTVAGIVPSEPLRMEMGTPNGHLPDVTRAGTNNAPRQALQVREKLTTYLSSPAGEVPWQHAVEPPNTK